MVVMGGELGGDGATTSIGQVVRASTVCDRDVRLIGWGGRGHIGLSSSGSRDPVGGSFVSAAVGALRTLGHPIVEGRLWRRKWGRPRRIRLGVLVCSSGVVANL